ncbi:hypothetical protein JTE90_017856 [Oedothorax gibbosus]|uniref:Globin domain-containing protein n=1 Tax=Oedothorax gibbosus TaxID=931172 RepID=A0AAV6V4M0_9ARAC|nr:hypothetical protein JTE90_017856 [Oedothorax gibbosus]
MDFVLSKLSWLWTPAGHDVPDPVTGLTPRQKKIVQNTWKIVRADSKKNGILIFMKLFEHHPEYQPLFAGFAYVPLYRLPSNGKLVAHAISVMYSLSSVVDNLDEPQCLVQLLQKIGRSHRTRNISGEHIENLSDVIIMFLKEKLGPKVFDERCEEAWRKSLDVASSVIVTELEGTD